MSDDLPSSPYVPLNKADFDVFLHLWCRICQRRTNCPILAQASKAIAFSDPTYFPAEWTEDIEGAFCNGYQPDDAATTTG